MSLKTHKKMPLQFSIFKRLTLLFFMLPLCSVIHAQQISEVITDFAGFWRSGVGALNATYPNTGHNVLSFKYNSVVYSTGVDDIKLTTNSIAYTPGDFKAFPVATVGGTINGPSIYIALASRYDGVPNGYGSPLPSLRIKDVLIDGVHGLDLGTGATNIPASSLINFPISTVNVASISDLKPDIVVSQIAQPSSSGDTLYFIDNTGAVVGNKLSINWTAITALGTYYLDLYTLPTSALCDTAKINGTSDKETTREIRLLAFKLSDFGISVGNAASVTGFILRASGTSDPAFIAYNAEAFSIPAPVITVQPITQVVCPNVLNSVTFSVTATGGSLTYQWRKNNVDIAGATNSTYTIANVTSASAGAYNVVVSNPVGSVVSTIAYLNISIAVQPSPAAQMIATGASCTLSVSANNASLYQWKKGGIDIPGATLATYIINPVTSTTASLYSVQVINIANSCATVTSNTVSVTGSKILYSKPGVNLNLPGSWGVATDGSGSSPVDFTRGEHTFIVKNNAATGGNLTIAGTLDVANAVTTITPNTTLDAAKIARSGTGSLAGSSSSNLTVRDTSSIYFKTGNDTLRNFTVHSGNVTLLNTLFIVAGNAAGTVTMNGGTLNTNGNLVFRSNVFGTSRLAPVTGGAVINGAATIERYIPAARGWRYLSVPISATGSPTINQAWQEGVTTASTISNPNPGYGGQITGGTTSNGYDQSSTNSPSIKFYDNSSNSFLRLPASPGTNIPITSYPAYSIYLRGDRGINLMQGLNAAITSTTLRIKGNVNTGNQPVPVNATNYTLVGNPYPSAIDFGTLTRSNVKNTMYIWDPKMAGFYGLGGYVTVSWNNSTNSYDRTASVSSVSQYIQSGEAFLVSSADQINPGILTFKEVDKSTAGSDLVYRDQEDDQRLRVNLYSADANDSISLLDGTLTTYAEGNLNIVDGDDAKKMYGSNQSINLSRDGQVLSIERRKTIIAKDTSFLNLYKMKIQNYKLEIIAGNLDAGNIIGIIKDSYSNTINNTPLNMNGTTIIPFSVDANPASYAVNRFTIVFESLGPLPVTFRSVKAYRSKKDIIVDWHTEKELNMIQYDVEYSADGRFFKTAASVPSKATNGGNADYSWTDVNVTPGMHYYRIKSLGLNNETKYSAIVNVNIAKAEIGTQLSVYPNPVKDNTVSLKVTDVVKGTYKIRVIDINGQLVKELSVTHEGGDMNYNFILESVLAPGKYQVVLSGNKLSVSTSFIKE